MTEQVAGRAGWFTLNTRVIGWAALFAGLIIAAHAGSPYLFNRTTLQSEVALQVKTTTGLAITSRRSRFELLPSPHVAMRDVRITDPSGALLVTADTLDGGVRLLPLVVGRIELADVALKRPHVVIDLAKQAAETTSVFGRALSSGLESRNRPSGRLGSISLIAGQIEIAARRPGEKQTLTDVNVAVDWRDLQSPVSLTGSLRASNIDADVALWIAQPLKLIRGERSALALNIRSIPLEISATGTFSGAPLFQFSGHIGGAAPDLTALLKLTPLQLSLPSKLANLTVSADANIGFSRSEVTRIDLQEVRAQADGNAFEGTGAFQNGSRPAVTATLATDRLSLAPFLAQAPAILNGDGTWSGHKFDAIATRPIDFDMRVSANHLRVGVFEIEDAAMFVLTKGDRVEVGFDEGSAYSGAIKGHASLGFHGNDVNLRAAGTITNADLATLSWDAFGRQVASGQLSGSMALSTDGDSPLQLIEHIQGWTKMSARDGDVSEGDLYGLLHQPAAVGGKDGKPPEGGTPFTTSTLNLRFDPNAASVIDGSLLAAASVANVAGHIDLGTRRLDVNAAVRDRGALPQAPSYYTISGALDRLAITRDSGPAALMPTAP